jgi:uncharacterized membrane protein
MLRGGLFAGLLGYATVVIVYAVFNAVSGRSLFYTPAMLGATLFYGLDDPNALQVSVGPVLAYNMVHVLGYLTIGIVGSWLVSKAERYPAARFAALFVAVFVAGHVYAALVMFAAPLLGGGAWWQIGVAGTLSAVVMAALLLRMHPLLRAELKRIPLGDEAEAEA